MKQNSKGEVLALKPIARHHVVVRIIGISPLIQHNWDEKAKRMMREKQAGRKTKTRDVRDPDAEFKAAMYLTEDGKHGIPARAIKQAIISAAHKDIGIEKTLVKKALFIYPASRDAIIEMDCDEPEMVEDNVRVGVGSADLRYRPYFHKWAVTLTFELDIELLRVEDLLTLLDRAGFGIGVCDWRPEKGGEYGRFKIDTDFKTLVTAA